MANIISRRHLGRLLGPCFLCVPLACSAAASDGGGQIDGKDAVGGAGGTASAGGTAGATGGATSNTGGSNAPGGSPGTVPTPGGVIIGDVEPRGESSTECKKDQNILFLIDRS